MTRLIDTVDERDEAVQTFVNKARVNGRLEHPNILPLHELGADGKGIVFCALRHSSSPRLSRIQTAQLSVAQRLTLFLKICDAVAFAHARGICHGSLTCAEIVVGDFGEVLVTNWGVEANAERLKADLRSLGVILRDLLGQQDVMAAVADATERGTYADVNELRSEIEAFQAGIATRAEEAGFFRHLHLLIRRNKTVAATAACLVLLLVTVGVVFVNRARYEEVLALDAAKKNKEAEQVARENAREAEELLERLRATAPAFRQEAQTCLQTQRLGDALKEIDHAIRLQPEQAEYHRFRGDLLQTMMRLDAAHTAYERALELDPQQAAARSNMELAKNFSTEEKALFNRRRELSESVAEQGRYYEALSLLHQIDHTPEQRKRIYGAILKDQNLSFRFQKNKWLQGVGIVMPHKYPADDLAALTGMQLDHFACYSKQLRNIDNLEGMELKHLRLCNTQVEDISCLKGMPLWHLHLCAIPATDFSALRGMPLLFLGLDSTRIYDLSPLEGMELIELMISQSPVKDLSGLRKTKIKRFHATASEVDDLEPLRSSGVKEVQLGRTKIGSLWPLKDCPLEKVDIRQTQVGNLEPLRGKKITSLCAFGTKIRDISPLRGAPLKSLNLAYQKVSSIEAVRGAPLEQCILPYTLVADLSPLAGAPLTKLAIQHSRVTDIAPLAKMPLKKLYIYGLDIDDLSPIAYAPLEELYLSPSRVKSGLGAVRTLKQLKKVGADNKTYTREEFLEKFYSN